MALFASADPGPALANDDLFYLVAIAARMAKREVLRPVLRAFGELRDWHLRAGFMAVWTVDMNDCASLERGRLPVGSSVSHVVRTSDVRDVTFPVGVRCVGDPRVCYSGFERCQTCGLACRPRMCGWCYAAAYCGRGCQVRDRAAHRPACLYNAERAARLVKSYIELWSDTLSLPALRATRDPLAARFVGRCEALAGDT